MASSGVTWKDCKVATETFAKVDDHELKCDIVVPPNLASGKHPLIISFHGGYLISGTRNFYMFLASWLPAFAARANAIIVTPDYRLLPSANAGDVRTDLESLWQWTRTSLPAAVSKHFPGHEVDLDRVLLEGHSAGGFCAGHLAMDHPSEVKGAILVYPMLHNKSAHLANGPLEKPTEANGMTLLTGRDLDARIEEEREKGWVSGRSAQPDFLLTMSIVKGGKYGELFGKEQDDPLWRVRNGTAQGLPPRVWILHGRDDTGVPAQGSIDFVEAVRKVGWKTDVRLDVIDDEPSEHGFDAKWDLSKEKLNDRLGWLSQSWSSGPRTNL